MPAPSPAWRRLYDALDFCRDRFLDWSKRGIISPTTAERLIRHLESHRERLGADAAADPDSPPPAEWTTDTGLSSEIAGPAHVASNWRFLRVQLERLQQAGQLAFSELHRCQSEIDDVLRYLAKQKTRSQAGLPLPRANVAVSGLPTVLPSGPRETAEATAPRQPAEPPAPKRPVLEVLLDPRTIQWVLAVGAGLFVFGLVLYLYSIGIFENPLLISAGMGAINLSLLAAGVALITRSRFQLAGRALALLACLIMPLNLWFYHAQGLLTLGGHLWVAAALMTGLFIFVAFSLRDESFVPVILAGSSLTGLLILFDLGRFWEVLSPATFLVCLGLAAIHVERAFGPGDGPFSRRRFGLAFFFSGQALLAGGLLFLFAAQATGDWMYEAVTQEYYRAWNVEQPALATEPSAQTWALILVLLGIYSCVYSDLVVRRVGIYMSLAAAGLIWAFVLVLRLLRVELGIEALAAIAAAFATALQLLKLWARSGSSHRLFSILSAFLLLGAFLTILQLHAQSIGFFPGSVYSPGLAFIGTAAAVIVGCRVAGQLEPNRSAKTFYFSLKALAELIGMAGLLRWAGMSDWSKISCVLIWIPIAQGTAAALYRNSAIARPLLFSARVSVILLIVSSLPVAFLPAVFSVPSPTAQLFLAGFFALTAVFYVLLTGLHGEKRGVYLATVMASLSIWLLSRYADVSHATTLGIFAGFGLGMIAAYRFMILEQTGWSALSRPTFESGNAVLSLALIGAAFQSLSLLSIDGATWEMLLLSIGLLFASLAAWLLIPIAGWQRWYMTFSVIHLALAVLIAGIQIELSTWQKLQLCGVVPGLAFVILSLIARGREVERESDAVGFGLFMGSWLIALPLMAGICYSRLNSFFSWPDEVGLLVFGLSLAGIGVATEIKWPTLAGAAMIGWYLVTLILFARSFLAQFQVAAILLTIAGGFVFGTGLILALYRDALLALPEKIRNREGWFRVLSWR